MFYKQKKQTDKQLKRGCKHLMLFYDYALGLK